MGIARRNNPKIVVVLGPTSSGKSDMAVEICHDFNGEVISADSRQVYKGMNIGSGKITTEEMRGVKHHLLDVANPNNKFSVANYKKMATIAATNIISQEKIPVVCGGTAFYIQAFVDGLIIPKVSPDWNLRKKLEQQTKEELFKQLTKIDKHRAKNIDKDNKVRIIRAIEIVTKTKKPVPKIKEKSPYNPLFLGIKVNQELLEQRIWQRIEKRLQEGMIEEVIDLFNSGISYKRLESFGLEYRWIARYLQKKISYDEMKNELFIDTRKFSKRQMRWWKNDQRINWIETYKEAKSLIQDFYTPRTNTP